MSSFSLSPSVGVSEQDYTFSIPAVSTSAGGFAGTFQWGPVLQSQLMSSPTNLLNTFYQPNDATYVSYFTAENFLQYSSNLNVVRVVGLTAVNAVATTPGVLIPNSDVYNADFSTNATTYGVAAAKYPGALGNGLRLAICDSANYFKSLSGNISSSLSSANVTGVSTHFTSETSPGSLLRNSTGVVIGRVLSITSDTALILTSNAAVAVGSGTGTTEWEFKSLFSGAPSTSTYATNVGGSHDEVHVVVQDTTGYFSAAPGTVLNIYPYLSVACDALGSDGSSVYYKNVLNRASQYIWHMSHPTSGTNWGSKAAGITFASLSGAPSYIMAGGISDDTLTDSIAIAGYNLFANASEIDIELIPLGGASPTTANEVISNIAMTRMDCIAFVSPLLTDVYQNVGLEAQSIITTRNLLPATSYASMDSGWKYQYDRYNDVYRWVPLNGDIAGLCAQVSATNDDWWSPAGYNRGQIKNVIKLAYNPQIDDRNLLYPVGVNPVITEKGQGTLLFGDKTLLARPSSFGQIGVRRLFILLEKAIATAAKYKLFEFNDAPTRTSFNSAVNPFLRTVQGGRGIVNFLCLCDTSNNTADVINAGNFVAQIYVQPNLSIQAIQLVFINTPAGTSFQELGG